MEKILTPSAVSAFRDRLVSDEKSPATVGTLLLTVSGAAAIAVAFRKKLAKE